MTEDQIKHMVDRFLGWKIPKDFSPDAGISYTPAPYQAMNLPSGTNLLDVTQADAMVRYMVEGLPPVIEVVDDDKFDSHPDVAAFRANAPLAHSE